jgi:hypothetical protein
MYAKKTIGYLLYLQHTYFDFQVATCFGINIPSTGHFFKCCQQLENKIIKIN